MEERQISETLATMILDSGLIENPRIHRIRKGNSTSLNYCVFSKNMPVAFAKVYPSKDSRRYEAIRLLKHMGAPFVSPLCDFELSADLHVMLLEWIDFDSLDVKTASAEEAANLLKSLQHLPIPSWFQMPSLYSEVQSINRKIEESGVVFDHYDSILEYLQATPDSVDSIKSFVHLDFHLGNIAVFENTLYLIDYENISISHPWRDLTYAYLFHQPSENCFWKIFLEAYFQHETFNNFDRMMQYFCYIQLLRMILCEKEKHNESMISFLVDSIWSKMPLS